MSREQGRVDVVEGIEVLVTLVIVVSWRDETGKGGSFIASASVVRSRNHIVSACNKTGSAGQYALKSSYTYLSRKKHPIIGSLLPKQTKGHKNPNPFLAPHNHPQHRIAVSLDFTELAHVRL